MRLDEQGRILIPLVDLVPAVWPKGTFDYAKNQGRINTTCRGGRGRSVEVIYDTLPDRYKSQICSALGDPRRILGVIPDEPKAKSRQRERVPFNELTPKELQLCNAKYNIVKTYREFADLHGPTMGVTAAKKEFITMVQTGLICEESYAVVGKLSFQTVERWNKELRDGGDIMDALAPLRVQKTGTSLTDSQKAILIEQYCKDTQPTFADAYRSSCRLWRLRGEAIPTSSMCRRFLMDWQSKNRHIVTFRRQGVKALNDKCLPYIERDPFSIQFLDVLVSDGHVMNFDVINPATGKRCRPTLIAWQDMRTQLILGFELMVTENTMSVASAFRNACLNAGRLLGMNGAILPRSLYLDNGKAFKNKFFNAKTDLRNQVGGLFERLKDYGLEHVQYARPYNSQTKVIERSWADFTDLEQMAVSYVGDCIDNKPAALKRNELWHREERAKAIAANGVPTLWGAYKVIEWWVGEYNTRKRSGKYLDGISPVELAQEQIPQISFNGRLLDSRGMDHMIMNTKTAKLGRNGFRINKVSYYNPVFTPYVGGDEVYILKYDILNTDRILVFREDGTFWCEAGVYFGSNIHAMAALGSDIDRLKRNQALKAQRTITKEAIKEATSLTPSVAFQPDMPVLAAANSDLLPPSATLTLPQPEVAPEPEIKLRFF